MPHVVVSVHDILVQQSPLVPQLPDPGNLELRLLIYCIGLDVDVDQDKILWVTLKLR